MHFADLRFIDTNAVVIMLVLFCFATAHLSQLTVLSWIVKRSGEAFYFPLRPAQLPLDNRVENG